MRIFEGVADPVRRRLLELLAGGERGAGDLTDEVRAEFGISQPAVSQHLKVLRDTGWVAVRADGPRRRYAVNEAALMEVATWLAQFDRTWEQPLDALATELARGRRQARAVANPTANQLGGTAPRRRATGA